MTTFTFPTIDGHKAKVTRSVWMGRPGAVGSYFDRAAVRVVVMRWDDAPDAIEVEVMSGDGRTPEFRKHHEAVTDEAGLNEALAYAFRVRRDTRAEA